MPLLVTKVRDWLMRMTAAYPFISRQGEELWIRELSLDDIDAYHAFLDALSAESIYRRFFSAHRPTSDSELWRALDGNGERDVVLGVHCDGMLTAVARAAARGPSAEVAFVVAEGWREHGIATELLHALARWAKEHSVETLTAETLGDNFDMLRVFDDAGYPIRKHLERGVWSVEMRL